jgi:nitroreductase
VKGPRAKVIPDWAHHQSYIAMGFLMETAGLLQIDACPMEGIDPAGYDKVLGIENSEYHTVAACAVGYRHAEDGYAKAKKVRFAATEIFDYRT